MKKTNEHSFSVSSFQCYVQLLLSLMMLLPAGMRNGPKQSWLFY